MQSCSEGSRGLSVPLRVIGIFTDTTISPSSWPRQCSDRYTIRAGRNLPDKEFRYLRTVIVTAAVYWGFSSSFACGFTSSLNLPAPGRCQALYVIFRFSRVLCFAKQSPEPFHCALIAEGPFPRSYRVNLPSSLATDHSSALGFSPRLPVSVCGTGNYYLSLEVFLGAG